MLSQAGWSALLRDNEQMYCGGEPSRASDAGASGFALKGKGVSLLIAQPGDLTDGSIQLTSSYVAGWRGIKRIGSSVLRSRDGWSCGPSSSAPGARACPPRDRGGTVIVGGKDEGQGPGC